MAKDKITTHDAVITGAQNPKETAPIDAIDESRDSEQTVVNDQDVAEPLFNPGVPFYLAFGSLCVIVLASALDTTAPSVALPIIAESLHGSAIEAFWVGTSFLLASTVVQPTFASISHIFGRKIIILLSVLFFAIGSIVAATAQNFTTLLVARSIQGVGGGGILSLVEIIITDIIPLRRRGAWFGIQGLIWALGSVTGPLMGGAFAQHASWRWIFWINLPICGVGAVMAGAFLHLNKRTAHVFAKLRQFDFVGCVLLTGSITSVLVPISWGGVMYDWSSWHTLVPLILGIFGMIGFCVYELHIEEPLVPLRIFNQRTAMVNYIGTFVQGIVIWSIVYYVPLYYEAVKGYSPTIVGVAALPETFTIVPASIVVGTMISKTGKFRWAICSGWALTVLGMGLLVMLDRNTSVPAWIFMNLVPGVGLGMLYNSLGYATQASTPPKYAGFAAAMYIFMRAFGQAVGVAVGGVIFQSQFEIKLSQYPSLASNATQLSQDASSLVQIIKAMPSDSPERIMIVDAYADALKIVWVVMAALSGAALLLSGLTESLSVDVKIDTEQGLREKVKKDGGSEPV